jgi:hypothetical protein
MAKGSAIPGYDVLVLKRRGVTRDLPSGTESLQWVTNTATLIYGEHDAVVVVVVVVDTFAFSFIMLLWVQCKAMYSLYYYN